MNDPLQWQRKSSRWVRWRSPDRVGLLLTAFLAASSAIAVALDYQGVQWLERHVQTLFFRWRGAVVPPEEVIILAIDNQSLAAAQKYLTDNNSAESYANLKLIESWPWRRAVYSVAIERLLSAGAKSISFDILFDLPSGYGEADDRRLQTMLQNRGDRVVLATAYLSNAGPEGEILERFEPISELKNSPIQLGLVNFSALEADGRVHRLGHIYGEEVLHPLGLEVLPPLADVALQVARINYPQPKGENIFFFGPQRTFKTIPFWQILVPDWWETFLQEETFKDKIVLIGSTSSTEFSDYYPTPFDEKMPGVEIHANAIATLLEGKSIALAFPNPGGRGLFVLFFVGGVGLAISRVRQSWRQAAWGGIGSVIWIGISYLTFTYGLLILPTMIPVGAIALTGFSFFASSTIHDKLEKRRLRNTLTRYVAEPVVKEILKEPDDFCTMLQGKKLKVAVLFSDIRGFTTLCFKMPPEQLIVQLNIYFHGMVEAIVGAGGTLDKFIGDAVMAEFGFPVSQGTKKDAMNAVRAALTMRQELARLRQYWRMEGRSPLFNGIGISYGEVVAGDIGSWRRREYAVLGDTVNVASRVEGLTKQLGTDILITESLYELVKNEVDAIDLGEHPLKGREESKVRLYSLVGLKGEDNGLYREVVGELRDYLERSSDS
ncbi:adenylate/guanylate cyclase domain-containing protein [Lusitaniella coriacea LEGE 07157]|uniref:Adenylate/guanylate cyclase domain-containing protein n=1 Tax=Lusitaniella coriacea LEGE 07157 TaxID=945747 RepID=A0A8J7DXZ7_9CYAN|nr:adenylate/guanylate cyclase domain-containing protein [Lusitaniella coriacea]MBE9117562.1 adenylate/guanylate cyclase domain-containing protein [Lusitaniella coriacea LEGE 07157]